MVARALLVASGEVEDFKWAFARELKRWIACVPPGVGFATLRGALRLLFGVHPNRSGVSSAGNGPAMRAALLGVCSRDDQHLEALVRASTRITHSDPRAEDGALLVARLARQLSSGAVDRFALLAGIRDAELQTRVRGAFAASSSGELEEFRKLGGYERGVSGFVVHTVPASIYCWARHPRDPRKALEAAIRLGGDTDTVAAITGALVGAEVGASGLPSEWIAGIRDWPLSIAYVNKLAQAVAEGGRPPRFWGWAALPRNCAVLFVILGHAILRLVRR